MILGSQLPRNRKITTKSGHQTLLSAGFPKASALAPAGASFYAGHEAAAIGR
jgi:hypothetical protein